MTDFALPWAQRMEPMTKTGALPHERIKTLIVPGFSPLADPAMKGWRQRTGLPTTRMSSPPNAKFSKKPEDPVSKDAVAPVVVIGVVLAVGYYLLVR